MCYALRPAGKYFPIWTRIQFYYNGECVKVLSATPSAKLFALLGFLACMGRDAAAEEVARPEYLYHWTSAAGLEELAAAQSGLMIRRLKPLKGSGLALHWAFYENKEGIFAWENPVGAISTGLEKYAQVGSNGEPPRLIVFKLKKNVVVAEVSSRFNQRIIDEGETPLRIRSAKVILHHSLTASGKRRFSEWVIVDPDAIEGVTADPKWFPKATIDQMKAALASAGKVERGAIFFPNEDDPAYRQEMLRAFFGDNKGRIPRFFQRAIDCSQLFSR